MESVTSQSTIKDWWSLGKWQAMAIVVTLGVYFAIYKLTGNSMYATFAAGVFAAFTASMTFTQFTRITADTAYFTSAAGVFVAGVLTTSAAATLFLVIFSMAAVAAFLFAVVSVTEVADKAVEYGVSRKVVWLSYAAEYSLILVPMLISTLL